MDTHCSLRGQRLAALENPQQRMKHWVTCLTATKTQDHKAHEQVISELSLLRKVAVALRSQRSRSPRRAIQDKPAQSGGPKRTERSRQSTERCTQGRRQRRGPRWKIGKKGDKSWEGGGPEIMKFGCKNFCEKDRKHPGLCYQF